MHKLPHRAETFAVALTSFGFNGVDPEEVIEQLNHWTESNGHFIWKPELARFIAWK